MPLLFRKQLRFFDATIRFGNYVICFDHHLQMWKLYRKLLKKITMKSTSLFLLCAALGFGSQAQFLVQQLPQDQILQNEKAYVVTNAGDTLTGRISNVGLANGTLSSCAIVTEEGRRKFKLADLKSLAVVPDVMARPKDMALVTTLNRAENEDFLKVVETDWVIFEKIRFPGRSERYELTQLLNPGYDTKIKVFANRNAGETMSMSSGNTKLLGGDDDSYFVSVNGELPVVIRKGKYAKEGAKQMYGDCPALQDQEMKWEDFAKHVFIYDQECM
ncbi:MAG: hypothetical protein ACJA2C_002006 [Marinoscillum sp.]|jgi:hypothetical protein